MNIDIRQLTPDLAEEYVRFFDVTPHNAGEGEIKCYCVTWRSDDSYVGNGDHWFPTQEERRSRAIQFVRAGKLQGYLAYQDEKVVGWCNATADCQLGINHLRSYWPIEERRTDIKAKSVFCFMIAPELRRTGVATKLLERVCQDAFADGYDFVEAYVNRNVTDTAHEFAGPLGMYEKCGFRQCAQRAGRVVMRKALQLDAGGAS